MLSMSRNSQRWRLPIWNYWRQKTLLSPTEAVENSIALWALISALVIEGIVAMDIASEGPDYLCLWVDLR